MNLSWHLNLNINNIRNLFSDVVELPYEIDCYFCNCGNKEIIIKNQDHDIDKYICFSCENEDFYFANKYLMNNSSWYEPISNLFEEEYLLSLEPKISFDNETKILHATISLDIPSSYDLASDKIIFHSRSIFEVEINIFENLNQTLLANFDLDSLIDKDSRFWHHYITEEELINKSSLLKAFKKKILREFKKYSEYFDSKIALKTNTLEEFSFFINNNHLLDLDFYKWKNINFLPNHKKLSIVDALDFIGNNRVEKTLKKSVIDNYRMQIRKDDNYDFIFIYSITRCIDDVNILNRMINIDLKSHLESIEDPYNLYIFIEFLSKRFSSKQIEKLFMDYSKEESFWLIHSINLFSEIYDYLDNFIVDKCRYDLLHDDIVNYHRVILDKKLFKTKFKYDFKFLNACVDIQNYEIRLPKDGVELYNWSYSLQNCLSGYWKPIKEKKTTVFGFFEDNQIKFAVEIKNNKIVQSKLKYNEDLQNKEMSLVLGWYKEYFENPQLEMQNNDYDRFNIEVFYFTYYGYMNITDAKSNKQTVINVSDVILALKILPYLIVKRREAIFCVQTLLDNETSLENKEKHLEVLKILEDTNEEFIFRIFTDPNNTEIDCEYVTKKADISRFNYLCISLIQKYEKFLEIGDNRKIYEKTMLDIQNDILANPDSFEQVYVFGFH